MPYLFSSKEERLDTQEFTYYGSGQFSNVYKHDDTILKIYKDDIGIRNYMSIRNFKFLRECDIPNFVKLIDYYHMFKGRIEKHLPMDAYTMEFVKDKKIELSDMSTEYLLDICKKLEETLEELSNKHILIEDAHEGNILFTENGVTIIDVDQFLHINLLTKRFIYQLNKEKIIKSINDTLIHEIYFNGFKGFFKFITPSMKSSLTNDIMEYLKAEEIEESVKKKVLSQNENI